MTYCSRCGYREAVARGRCRGCYEYFTKNGVERPLRLIQKHYERQTGRSFKDVVREMERRLGRSLAA